ncbi:hypothetical protein GE09DRAFT_1065683 [Coniochaeta sp. 2T2.1]|nr:hypothetical protein GE09DRAFT_1065683 [Coniochaeta sp. 2T2.1]
MANSACSSRSIRSSDITTYKPQNIVLTGAALARHLFLAGHRLFLIGVDGDELSHTVHVHLPSVLKSQGHCTDQPSSSSSRLSSCTADLRDRAAIQSAIEQAVDSWTSGSRY